ncbi:MAG TPA: DNA repair protein RecO [Chitinispirillaceae bacterium]|nr:DNA repair protein RecO [Chitinispirillaceae bacterium]
MSIHKTNSIVLSTTPFRESSLICTLFSEDYGRFQGIAKGIRSSSKYTVPLERGMLIEHVVYVKKTREIQTLADIQIGNFYPEIRGDIEKTAVRDTAFELLISSLKAGDRNLELFSLVTDFLDLISHVNSRKHQLLLFLWDFHFRFASAMGFACNFSTCIHCHSSILPTHDRTYLIHEQGGVICNHCGELHADSNLHIPSEILFLYTHPDSDTTMNISISSREWLRLIRLASTYCRIHLELKYPFRSIDFLEQVFV